jgi:hypothetical protein
MVFPTESRGGSTGAGVTDGPEASTNDTFDRVTTELSVTVEPGVPGEKDGELETDVQETVTVSTRRDSVDVDSGRSASEPRNSERY